MDLLLQDGRWLATFALALTFAMGIGLGALVGYMVDRTKHWRRRD